MDHLLSLTRNEEAREQLDALLNFVFDDSGMFGFRYFSRGCGSLSKKIRQTGSFWTKMEPLGYGTVLDVLNVWNRRYWSIL